MTTHDDDEIRATIDALREDDAKRAPAFHLAWNRATSRARQTPRSRVPILRWIAIAACLLVVAGLLARRSLDRRSTPPMSIHRWSSPTAELLRTPGSELLQPQPILSSVLDGATRLPSQTKGGL